MGRPSPSHEEIPDNQGYGGSRGCPRGCHAQFLSHDFATGVITVVSFVVSKRGGSGQNHGGPGQQYDWMGGKLPKAARDTWSWANQ